jgi:hypothetical protein
MALSRSVVPELLEACRPTRRQSRRQLRCLPMTPRDGLLRGEGADDAMRMTLVEARRQAISVQHCVHGVGA